MKESDVVILLNEVYMPMVRDYSTTGWDGHLSRDEIISLMEIVVRDKTIEVKSNKDDLENLK
ncbi:hypothetical protein BMR02_10075 [Methylococcaceae bacterium HT1]|nr:hypothetical protein BMR02_10075 [Methylococcaceae bacterium HT1]TXL09433.1 hypothetical protein BMR08_13420 [Methylococcaceae bacterium CS2]TXL19015.1 hypothetical protein BMR06_12005 [Methylococcaceae bacterium HT5]TXL22729.1 hypothetical protein BMR03_06565 [Methylococcaceae bacterium HT2]